MNDMQDRDAVRGADPTAFVKAAAEQACAAGKSVV